MVFTWIFNFRPKVTPQGLVAALDLQVPIFGLGNTWMDGFSIFVAKMVPYEYDRLLEYADLKYLHVCANSGTLKCIEREKSVRVWSQPPTDLSPEYKECKVQ